MWKKIADELNQLHDMKWNKKQETIFCLAHVIQLVVKKLISELKIEATDESISISFDEDDVKSVKSIMSFENTLHKTSLW